MVAERGQLHRQHARQIRLRDLLLAAAWSSPRESCSSDEVVESLWPGRPRLHGYTAGGARRVITATQLSVPLDCAVMSQHGAMPAAWEETSFTGGPQGAGGHLDCPGLRQCAVRPDTVPGFQKMCRVLDTPFSTISASILFELRADAGEPAAPGCLPSGLRTGWTWHSRAL